MTNEDVYYKIDGVMETGVLHIARCTAKHSIVHDLSVIILVYYKIPERCGNVWQLESHFCNALK